jgi:hypothetical protein
MLVTRNFKQNKFYEQGDPSSSSQEEKADVSESGWTDEDFIHIRGFLGNGRRNKSRHEIDDRQLDVRIEDSKTGKIVIIKNDDFKTQQILQRIRGGL